jgi:hypothetical protein
MSSYSDPRSRSPRLGPLPKSPFKMTRSVTTPVTRSMAPPSPDYTSNLDCAFPRFPSKNATPKGAKPRPRDRLEPTYQHHYAPPSPLFAPLSPRMDGGENVSKRMDTIMPGPFDGKADRRPSTSSASKPFVENGPALGHRRTATSGSTVSNGSIQKQRTSVTSNASRGSAYSNRSLGLPSRPKPGMGGADAPPPLPSTSEQNEGIDAFLVRLQKESTKPAQINHDSIARANPLRQDSGERREPPPRPRRPSERDLPADMSDLNSSDFLPRSNATFLSRGSSRSGSESDMPRGFAPTQALRPPPLVAAALGLDTQLNALHTPSDSGFSDDSYASSGFRSIASSRSSPPESEAGHSRQASKIGRPDYIAEEGTVGRSASPESYAASLPVRAPRSYMRPDGAEPIPRALSPGYAKYPESPMDPAIQMGAPRDLPKREPATPQDPAIINNSAPRRMAEPEPRQPETRRPKAASKGNCRGCSEPIIGKSVKDSSGRLTGRYHKQCFVCRTCADPFPTAEFYVFENSPYCEQHYHKLNGSLCNSCDIGIEGQYLETDLRQKFHPRCFTCTTCRVVLQDGYFDVAGQRYCDRHAQSAAAPPRNYLGPGGYKPRNLQKRGTRLMMMA